MDRFARRDLTASEKHFKKLSVIATYNQLIARTEKAQLESNAGISPSHRREETGEREDVVQQYMIRNPQGLNE